MLPDSFDIIRSFIDKNSLFFVFTIFAIIISLVIEGICQIGAEKSFASFDDDYFYDKDEKGNVKNLKYIRKFTDRIKWRKYKLLEYIFIRPSIMWECRRYTNGKEEENPMKTFTDDLKGRADSWHFFKGDSTYNAVYICARVIERNGKIADIYRYRDNSYVVQMLRLSFLCIILSVPIFYLVCIIFLRKSNFELCLPFFIFNLVVFAISCILFIKTTNISSHFGKRFIREVGYTYEALKLDLLIDLNEESSIKINNEK
jgi:hypothetical protein